MNLQVMHSLALMAPGKRDRSADRDISRAEKERLLLRSNSSGSIITNEIGGVPQQQSSQGTVTQPGTPHSQGGGGGKRGSLAPSSNHLPPDKVAFERHLLLGDPDWSSRTVADRNTLPRKKPFDYRGSVSPPEEVYSSMATSSRQLQKSSPATPAEESHRSSDDVFCPACAHQQQQQQHQKQSHFHPINRESRVSFGSIASSSRASSSGKGQHISQRMRSRSQEDEESSGHHISSSVPTPPPPPSFLSQRDLAHSSLLETINQKMSILSSIKNAIPAAAVAAAAAAVAQKNQQQQQNSYHSQPPPLPPRPQTATAGLRRSSAGSKKYSQQQHQQQHQQLHLEQEQAIQQEVQMKQAQKFHSSKSNGRKSSSYSLKEQSPVSASDSQPEQPPVNKLSRSSRSSSRTTPRESSSHASHESIRSNNGAEIIETVASVEVNPRSPKSPREEGSYEKMGDEVDKDISDGGSIIGIRRSSRPRSRSQQEIKDENESGGEDRNTMAQGSSHVHQTGTVRRRRRVRTHNSSKSNSSQEKIPDQVDPDIAQADEHMEKQQLHGRSKSMPNAGQMGQGERYFQQPIHHSKSQQPSYVVSYNKHYHHQHYPHHPHHRQNHTRHNHRGHGHHHRPYSRSQEHLDNRKAHQKAREQHRQESHPAHSHGQHIHPQRRGSSGFTATKSSDDLVSSSSQQCQTPDTSMAQPQTTFSIGEVTIRNGNTVVPIHTHSLGRHQQASILTNGGGVTSRGTSTMPRTNQCVEFRSPPPSSSSPPPAKATEAESDENPPPPPPPHPYHYHQPPPPPQYHPTMARPNSYHDNVAGSHSLRPRSASIGDRLSDDCGDSSSSGMALVQHQNKQTVPTRSAMTMTRPNTRGHPVDRRHHTLESHSQARRGILTSSDRRLANMISFQQSSTSSKSEKSSSRSSKSPSMENLKQGCNSSKCKNRNSILR